MKNRDAYGLILIIAGLIASGLFIILTDFNTTHIGITAIIILLVGLTTYLVESLEQLKEEAKK